MGKKEEYKQRNEAFLAQKAGEEGVMQLPAGILYKVVQTGNGGAHPTHSSIVTVHYRGSTITGKEFDNSRKRGCPEAFRLGQLIEGWQIAMQQMCVGDRWKLYIPSKLGYGSRNMGDIPAFSVLIFDVELMGIG